MHNVTFRRRAMSWIVSLALLTTMLPVSALTAVEDVPTSETQTVQTAGEGITDGNGTNEAVQDSEDVNTDIETESEDGDEITLFSAATGRTASGYYLMNIPYAEFYDAIGTADNTNFDAISSATNKVGNYGKSGDAFHSGTTANVSGGTVTAVGGANGAKNEGVIWPVKISGFYCKMKLNK